MQCNRLYHLERPHNMFMQCNRLYHLERPHNMFMQCNRRESFEIVGITSTVSTDDLEEEVIDICNYAKVFANTQPLKKSDICAVHRLADQKTTVVRVLNRKLLFVVKTFVVIKGMVMILKTTLITDFAPSLDS